MHSSGISRRDALALIGTAVGAASTVSAARTSPALDDPRASASRARRIRWWTNARFGMFIHWGVHSVIGRDVWNMEHEAIPVDEYRQLGKRFTPPVGAPRTWARLARQTGQKYMVLTSKNHDGYCLFDTKTTDFCSTKQACGRDLVAEYVEAARAEGMRVGLYFSMMDWLHPDGIRCAVDEAARKRFVEYIHTQVREICSNYGKLDVLWWDGSWPLDARGWETEKLHRMVFGLQPDIVINDRGSMMGDFSTPEQKIEAADQGRAWETCMTINGAWGYTKADENWKTPGAVLGNLITCARGGGNYLLNIGPRPDGSVPEGSVAVLDEVGRWMSKYGDTIYGSENCKVFRSNYVNFTRKGTTLFMHVYRWPGDTITLARFKSRVKSARWYLTGKPVEFRQEVEKDPREPSIGFPLYRVKFVGLPQTAPDKPLAVLAAEFEAEPEQDLRYSRWAKKS